MLNMKVVNKTSYLLERVFKQGLPGDGDLHVAGEGVGLRKTSIITATASLQDY